MPFSIRNTENNTSYDKDSKIWRGLQKESKYGPQDSIGSVALKTMLEYSQHIGQICHQTGRQLRNMEIAIKAIQIAQHFEKLQLKQCDIIGLCAANTEYVAPLFFGALTAGLSISTLDPSYDKKGIKIIYSCTQPRMIFCDGINYWRIREAFDECGLASSPVVTLNGHIKGVPSILEFFEQEVKPEEYNIPLLENGANQVAVIVCTSGTTGFPKEVCISHAALLQLFESADFLNRRFLCFSSLFWLTGIATLIQGTIGRATRIISEKPFKPEDFFQIVKQHKVDIFMGPPSQMALALSSNAISDSDFSSLEYFLIGGGSISYALTEKFKAYAPQTIFYGGYASSETCCGIAAGICEPSNAVGTIGSNVEIKIIDNDDGKHLGPNESGEICVRTRLPWAGYYKNPERTKAIYDAEGWIHTGDNGYINDEGKLFLIDRKADIRKFDNFHFSPSDIEKVINELPQVADVCVVGIPDIIHGHLPAAAVIKRPESTIDEKEIYQYVVDRMQNFEHLRGGVYFFESLPRTVTGKTVRRKVVEMCQELKQSQKC
uniref:AMP-dependent synthetase/ligase domain-containing protein n=1 Tax=Stomoxys calcitrans TaxID=35570 RepID=A0A1I8Q2J7_STOCA